MYRTPVSSRGETVLLFSIEVEHRELRPSASHDLLQLGLHSVFKIIFDYAQVRGRLAQLNDIS